MITVIDYQTGNVGSILNILKKIGVEAKASSNTNDIRKANKIIIPGVGAFDYGMENLKKLGLIPALNEKVIEQKTPVLGICLGMQLFAQRSEEGNSVGLSWIDAETTKFKFDEKQKNLKIPHMGWNNLIIKKNSPLLEGLGPETRFYFVHSYYLNCKNPDNVTALSLYGYEFPSVVEKENVYGVQFHPEKSHKFGLKLLKNFAELC